MMRPLLTALLLLVVAFLVRLQGITTLDPHTDEQHWLSRSAKFLYKLEHDPWHATSHFGHPGLAPGILMAGAQVAAQRFNDQFRDGAASEPLVPSRVAMAFVGSAAVPLLFLLMYPLFGVVPAFFAGLLLMLDPHHVGLSRLAHLDAALTTFILLATLLYVVGVQHNRRGFVLWSGVVWGLAIATKPTAAAFVPALFLYRMIRWRRLPERPAPLWWVDVWAVIIGHAVLVGLSTRFWSHKSEFLLKLKVRSGVARAFHRTGLWLEEHLWVAFGGSVLLLVLVMVCLRLNRRGVLGRWSCHLSALLALFFLILALAPALLENIARYWSWAAGLSGLAHDGFGHRWPSPTYGYFSLIAASLPELVLVGLLLGLVALAVCALRGERSERICLLGFILVFAVLWCIPLQTASKQGWRYALPVVPFLYLLCAYGYWSAVQLLAERRKSLARSQQMSILLLIVVVLWQSSSLIRFEPYPLVYVNYLMGGLKGAERFNISYPPVGLVHAAQVLDAEAKRRNSEIFVTLLGDEETMRLAARLLPMPRAQVRYSFFKKESADYLLAPVQLRDQMLGDGWQEVLNNPPIFRYAFQGAVVYEIFTVPATSLEVPWDVTFRHMAQVTGRMHPKECLEVRSGLDRRGVVASHFGLNVEAMTVHAQLKGEVITPDEDALIELSLGGDCKRSFRPVDHMNSDGEFEVEFDCAISASRRVRPVVAWSGKGALCLRGITLERGEAGGDS